MGRGNDFIVPRPLYRIGETEKEVETDVRQMFFIVLLIGKENLKQ